MPIIEVSWFYLSDVERWQRLEANGEIVPLDATRLAAWRKTHARQPLLTSMEEMNGSYDVAGIDTGKIEVRTLQRLFAIVDIGVVPARTACEVVYIGTRHVAVRFQLGTVGKMCVFNPTDIHEFLTTQQPV